MVQSMSSAEGINGTPTKHDKNTRKEQKELVQGMGISRTHDVEGKASYWTLVIHCTCGSQPIIFMFPDGSRTS